MTPLEQEAEEIASHQYHHRSVGKTLLREGFRDGYLAGANRQTGGESITISRDLFDRMVAIVKDVEYEMSLADEHGNEDFQREWDMIKHTLTEANRQTPTPTAGEMIHKYHYSCDACSTSIFSKEMVVPVPTCWGCGNGMAFVPTPTAGMPSDERLIEKYCEWWGFETAFRLDIEKAMKYMARTVRAACQAEMERRENEMPERLTAAQEAGYERGRAEMERREKEAVELLERIEAKQVEVLGVLRRNNIIFDKWPRVKDDGSLLSVEEHWQKVAFSLYTDIVEMTSWAKDFLSQTGKEEG